MENERLTSAALAIRPKAAGRNVPLAKMLADLSKLSVDGTKFFDTFTIFPRLPLDLRLKIWGHACFEPRAVMLFVAIDPEDHTLKRTYPGQRKIPAVLQTSRESRSEALRYYTKTEERIFPATVTNLLAPGTPPANGQPFQPIQFPAPFVNKIYVNFLVDRFQHQNIISRLLEEAARSPTGRAQLVLDYHFSHTASIEILDQDHDFHVTLPMISTLKNFFAVLTGLKELTFIHRDPAAPGYWLRSEDSWESQMEVNDMKALWLLEEILVREAPAHIRKVKFNAFVSLPGGIDLGPVGLSNGKYARALDISRDPLREL